MRQTIPYEKKIKFKTKISEISSISLEHELNVLSEEVNGEFIVSGEYKTHEISINKEPFLYKLPFSVTITDNIDKNSINFEILDFTYDIVNNDSLKVNIEFELNAEELKPKDIIVLPEVEEREEVIIPFEEEVTKKEENTILDNIPSTNENNYITYHVHIVKETDTFESISSKYNVELNTIKNINKVEDLVIGDKLLVPSYGEE